MILSSELKISFLSKIYLIHFYIFVWIHHNNHIILYKTTEYHNILSDLLSKCSASI